MCSCNMHWYCLANMRTVVDNVRTGGGTGGGRGMLALYTCTCRKRLCGINGVPQRERTQRERTQRNDTTQTARVTTNPYILHHVATWSRAACALLLCCSIYSWVREPAGHPRTSSRALESSNLVCVGTHFRNPSKNINVAASRMIGLILIASGVNIRAILTRPTDSLTTKWSAKGAHNLTSSSRCVHITRLRVLACDGCVVYYCWYTAIYTHDDYVTADDAYRLRTPIHGYSAAIYRAACMRMPNTTGAASSTLIMELALIIIPTIFTKTHTTYKQVLWRGCYDVDWYIVVWWNICCVTRFVSMPHMYPCYICS